MVLWSNGMVENPNVVNVKLPNHNYKILIGSGLIDSVTSHLEPHLSRDKIVVVTDSIVADLYLDRLKKNLKDGGIKCESLVVPSGEHSKSWEVLTKIVEWLLEKRIERDDVILALGGGMIGDLVGFSASIVRRGVSVVQLPTTLLSQVDSSVGGKTGINSSHGKNLIGTFYQPSLVIADTALLKTLPRRDFLSGYSEVVKYGLLGDLNFFEWLEKKIDCFLNVDPTIINSAVRKACMAKCRIVVADEKERGERALLNLGHTFGHALESWTNYSDKLLHGEGVSIGCVLAFRYSKELGYCSYENVDRVIKHFKSAGLKTELTDIPSELPDAEKFIRLMLNDKKVKNGRLNLILARCIGKAFVSENVCVDRLRSFLVNELDYSS